MPQAAYYKQKHINVRTFTARLSDHRKLTAANSLAFVPVQIEPTEPSVFVAAPATAAMVYTHVHGHPLERPPSVSAA